MNRLDIKTRSKIINLLVEGNSLRAVSRIAGVSRNTVDKLLRDVGAACLDYQDKHLRNLPCKRVECDEIWSFVYSKAKNVPKDKQDAFGYGDVWTWVALCADTKLVACWHVDDRSARAASLFINDLANRLSHRVQLTTDGHKAYLQAVDEAFGRNIDYARLIKMYGVTREGEKRYSPSKIIGSKHSAVFGNPDMDQVSTSYVERQNLTMRMHMRRFTRLTNGFSKKVENHCHAISLHYMYYNFAKIHKTLKTTPAMAAGVSDHVWEMEKIATLADENTNSN